MCSILGYSGKDNAASVLVDGLKLMEYRGYDSVGVATIKDEKILISKGVGKVAEVNQRLGLEKMEGSIGIGHTRWATHGGVTDGNAHPHSTCQGDIAVVHNGIIENYQELKDELIKQGHSFKSQTDSEVIAHLLEAKYSKGLSIKEAIVEACKKLRGSYAFVAAFKDGNMAAARWEEPLIIGISPKGIFISSDVLGFLKFTDKAIFLDNGDIAIIEDSNIALYDIGGNPVSRPVTPVAWELGAANKGEYEHHTLKEINEQARTTINKISSREGLDGFCKIISEAEHVFLTGSGSSHHVALLARRIFAKFARIQTSVIVSSEFQYEFDFITPNSVLVAISQSGESADVLNSVKKAKEMGAKILSIVNVTTSSLARMSDAIVAIECGPEIGVAATKSFTGHLAAIYAIVNQLAKSLQNHDIIGNLDELSSALEKALSSYHDLAKIAELTSNANNIYLLGRSMHYPIALEGALKLKELAYIHAEGLAAGELKHGPLALMDKNVLVLVLNPTDNTYEETLHNIHEIKARGATVIGVSDRNSELYDHWIELPQIKEQHLYPLIEVIPLQILAYLVAVSRKVDPDYPRNLAKSVTVK
ncbi:MAG TPA: glutamine--fructose-6-phosphate transaminase (isomerizing) [Nitrososphaera sp.]